MLPFQNQEAPKQTIQFRYTYNEEDIRNYITREVRSSQRGKTVLAVAMLFLLLSCVVEIVGTIGMNTSPAFYRFWGGQESTDLSFLPCLFFAQFLILIFITSMLVPSQLTTRLFHSLTWDGNDMLITISDTGWSRKTTHWLTEVNFSELAIKTQETREAIIIEVPSGPVLFLSKRQLSAETLKQLQDLLPALSAEVKTKRELS